MKKRVLSLCMAAALLVTAVPVMAEESDVTISVDGVNVEFSDQKPVIKENRTLVPVRGVLEAMGVDVTWDESTKTIGMSKGDKTATLVIGSDTLMIGNSEKVTLDVAPEIIGERTMLPIRAAAEAFDAEVGWDDSSRTITITTAKENTETTTPETDNSETETPSEKTFEKSEVTLEAVEGTNAYSKASYTAVLKDADGKSLIEATVSYPALNGRTTGDATVNAYIAENVDTYVNEYINSNAEATAKEASNLGDSFRTHTIYVNFEDVYYDDSQNVISYLETISTYTGGAHPNTIAYGMTIDTEKGQQVSISELVGESEDTAISDTERAANFLKEEIAANPDTYFENAEASLDEAEPGMIGCYLGEDKVIVFAAPYAIASYAQGLIKFDAEI